ncbi:MAG: sulfatase [Limnochordia bacterium]|nr:sulfatase [Limnochordia bacterium]MDD4518246.1 sulfatase [Limnochordia bacterium]
MSERPNIVFIMSDDHAAHAISAYGSRINRTPNIDRIANGGMRLDNCFCTNSICAPSRASILTGTHSHINGVRTLADRFDARQLTFDKLLQQSGYQTCIIGKWHLGHGGFSDPQGFDYWNVLPGQGAYHDPEMIEMGEKRRYQGYVTDIITDLSLGWLKSRDTNRPFCLLVHHKAPHRPWIPDQKHANLYEDVQIPEPETFNDDYANRATAAREAQMRIDEHLYKRDTKIDPPAGLNPQELKKWKYQRYIKDYLRCVASIDDNVGRLLNYLDEENLTENTIVIYTSDQGFFLGDHGWYDKRFMYEESLRMPFLIRYPKEIQPQSALDAMVLNIDFAPLFLDYAGLETPNVMQGRSFRQLLRGETIQDWRESMYYRYWMHLGDHYVYAHYGLRTYRYKLIYYYGEARDCGGTIDEAKTPEWELFDLQADPFELFNVYHEPAYQDVVKELKAELLRQRREVGDEDCPWDDD